MTEKLTLHNRKGHSVEFTFADGGECVDEMHLEVIAWVDANPTGVVRIPVWPETAYTKEEWRKWFLGCLNDKINRNEPKRGRKDCPEWDALIRRTAREVNTPRLIVRWVPLELRSRLSHRLEVG